MRNQPEYNLLVSKHKSVLFFCYIDQNYIHIQGYLPLDQLLTHAFIVVSVLKTKVQIFSKWKNATY